MSSGEEAWHGPLLECTSRMAGDGVGVEWRGGVARGPSWSVQVEWPGAAWVSSGGEAWHGPLLECTSRMARGGVGVEWRGGVAWAPPGVYE